MRQILALALVFSCGATVGWIAHAGSHAAPPPAPHAAPLPVEHVRCPVAGEGEAFVIHLRKYDVKSGQADFETLSEVNTRQRGAVLLTWGVPVDERVTVSPAR